VCNNVTVIENMAEEGMDIKDMFILHEFPSKYGLGLNLLSS